MAAEYRGRCEDCASHNKTVLCSWKNQFSLFVSPNCAVSRILIFHENFGWCATHIYMVDTHTHAHTHLNSLYPSVDWHSMRSPVEWTNNHPPSNCLALCVYNPSDCQDSATILYCKCNIINTACFCLQQALHMRMCFTVKFRLELLQDELMQ